LFRVKKSLNEVKISNESNLITKLALFINLINAFGSIKPRGNREHQIALLCKERMEVNKRTIMLKNIKKIFIVQRIEWHGN